MYIPKRSPIRCLRCQTSRVAFRALMERTGSGQADIEPYRRPSWKITPPACSRATSASTFYQATTYLLPHCTVNPCLAAIRSEPVNTIIYSIIY